MAWFRRSTENIGESQSRELPDGLWTKCEKCSEILYKKQLEENAYTCVKCGFHFRISSREYIELLLDPGTFAETDKNVRSQDALHFVDSKPYAERIEQTIRKSGLFDALRTG